MSSLIRTCATVAAFLSAFQMAGCSCAAAAETQTVTAVLTVQGPTQTRIGTSSQFSANVADGRGAQVAWRVNGIIGGSVTLGTITATGLYVPPSKLPSPATVAISGVLQSPSEGSASIIESILQPRALITSAVATPTSPNHFALYVTGMGFVENSQITVSGVPIATTLVSSTALQANITSGFDSIRVNIAVVNPNPGSSTSGTIAVSTALATVAAAGRILDQTTFGPTSASILHVQSIGLPAYLAEQLSMPTTLMPLISNPAPAGCGSNLTRCEQSEWWKAALTADDQLRQRVALALSEMFVVSSDSIYQRSIVTYQNTLLNDAFTNFATIMKDVTLSPAMGEYLNMVNSAKPTGTQIANENFARELLQLFTTGLYLLNSDGTPMLSASNALQPVYTEAEIEAFARAFTGWTYATASGGTPAVFPNLAVTITSPLVAVEAAHDTGAKALLSGTVLPAGQSAEQDLDGALANVFEQPNVGPFVCRQLIQHLVTGNPSPAYVERVAAVFTRGPQGVRGDMTATIGAILEDEEARAGDIDPSFDGGHLREPLLYVTGVERGLGAINVDPNGFYFNLSYNTTLLGEEPYAAPSVFSFFAPDYELPDSSTTAPEFALENTGTSMLRESLAEQMVFNKVSSVSVNLDAYGPLGIAASHTGNAFVDSTNLVNLLGAIFMHGEMPAQMQDAIVTHVSTITDIAERVRVATYLVISSSFYKISH